MGAALPAIILLLAVQAGAQDLASMGRLFTTQSERAQLDAQRNQAPQAPAGASSGQVGQGMQAATPCAPGKGSGCPASGAVAPSTAAVASGTASGAEPAQSSVETPEFRLDGVIRRSHGPTVVIVNGQVQPAPASGVSRGTVTLQSDGRAVVLKPGQSYDPATGEIHEAAR